MIEIIETNLNDATLWNDYVHRCPESSIYQDYRWREVLEKSFGLKTYYLMARNAGKVTGVLPLSLMKSCMMKSCLVSLSYLNYAGILAEDEETADKLLEQSKKILKEHRLAYLELRHAQDHNRSLVTRKHKVTMWLYLKSKAAEQWEALDKKVRNQIRKAEKEDFETRMGGMELLNDFYRVFARHMRDLGTPVLGQNFFQNILKVFPQDSRIFVVRYKNQPVAAALTLKHRDRIEIPWASSLKAFNPLCVNMLLYWKIIEYAIREKCRIFDLGRCTKNGSTYDFKKQWGCEEEQLYWQYASMNPSNLPAEHPANEGFSTLVSIWKRLPLFLANRLGPIVAKQISTF